ncbi:MAG: UDP-N-acetylmuramate dehydrogenase [Lachnospiraceae bacterium]|nr:UDP-N-acetylmuramate dehydrogenase [Lachnospiraceae bacterium]
MTKLLPKDRILRDESLSRHTTFRTGGPADYFLTLETLTELKDTLAFLREKEIGFFLLGRGSNVLVSDKGYRGVIISLGGEFNVVDITLSSGTYPPNENSDNFTNIHAGAGTSLAALASFACKHSLTGLEFASGIPGSVGGGVIMNAGAYGSEIKDVLRECTILDKKGNIRTLSNQEMAFDYRTSRGKTEGFIILDALFSLKRGNQAEIQSKIEELNQKRREKQPLEYPSAGSTFKRPPGQFAGKLIEEAGLKGLTVGGAQVSPKHCGFIVNNHNAASSDIYRLIKEVREKVAEKSGIWLESEVIFLGEF